jgi:hypothetical protein
VTALVQHTSQCAHKGFGHSDAAKRLSDGVNDTYARYGPMATGRFIAARLDTGQCRRELYDTKRDAVRDQSDEFLCLYLRLPLYQTLPVCEAELLLAFHRKAYDAGFRLADPDAKSGGKSLILPKTIEGINRAISTFRRK